jgi:hypothetical protein
MPKKKPPKKNEIPQKERFVTAARNAGASEIASDFDAAFAKVVTKKSKPSRRSSG